MTAGEVIATLTRARQRRRLGQERVAARLGKDRRSILRWERHHCSPSLDTAADWAAALGYRLTLEPTEQDEVTR